MADQVVGRQVLECNQSLITFRYAPECLYDSMFTHASDMWSFGVLFWESLMYGAKPWAGLTGQAV